MLSLRGRFHSIIMAGMRMQPPNQHWRRGPTCRRGLRVGLSGQSIDLSVSLSMMGASLVSAG